MNSANPHISIIVPAFNAAPFISDFIESIRSQTYQNWTCLIVDDGSSDNTYDILLSLTHNDKRFLILTNPSPDRLTGPSTARNIALKHANSSLIAFCDIDDLWHPYKLQFQTAFHVTNNLDISVTGFAHFKQSPTSPIRDICVPPPTINPRDFIGPNPIPLLTVLIKRSALIYDFPDCRHEDLALWIKLFTSNLNVKCACLPFVLSFYRLHNLNITSNKTKMIRWTYQAYRCSGFNPFLSTLLLFSWLSGHVLSILITLTTTRRSIPTASVADLMAAHPIH